MIVKQIIGECLVKMGKFNFIDAEVYTDEQSEIVNRLVGALRVIYSQVVTHYLPRICKEEVVIDDGKIEYSTLKNKIIYPISVIRGENKEKFKSYYDRLEVDFLGNATIVYAYMPDIALTLDSEITDANLTQNALSNGTLGEFYFEEKLFDLARNFDTDFRAEMDVLKLKGKSFVIKRRRWQA